MKKIVFFLMLTAATFAQAQLWNGILTSCTTESQLLPSGTYAGCGIDWTQVGIPGGIPVGSQAGSTIEPTGGGSNCTNSTTDCSTIIQNALNACGGSAGNEKYVLLDSGTYLYNATSSATVLVIPSYCYLTGMGANLTILNQGTGSYTAINFGSISDVSAGGAVAATSGSGCAGPVAGSTCLQLPSVSAISIGQLLVISELNNSSYVDAVGSEDNSNGLNGQFCGYNWGPGSVTAPGHARLHCQVTQIANKNSGTSQITLATPLVTDYGDNATVGWTANTYYGQYGFITDSGYLYEQTAPVSTTPFHCKSGSSKPTFPTSAGSVNDGSGATQCTWTYVASSPSLQAQVIVYSPNRTYAGIENLQINGVTTNSNSTIRMYDGAYNFIKGVQINYTNCNWVEMVQGFRNEVRDSYFSNSYKHGSGGCDAMLEMRSGESNSLVENNIFERGHVGAVLLESGPTGNVIGYNYCEGNFPGDNGSGGELNIPCFQYHGGHPQFNLHEGNVSNTIRPDSVWGTSSHGVLFRNWDIGTTLGCSSIAASISSVTPVVCSPPGYPYQSGAKSWYMYQQSQGIEFVYAANFFNAIGDVVGSPQVQTSTFFKTTGNVAVTRAVSLQWPSSRNYDNYYGIVFGFSESGDGGSFALDSTRPFTTALIHGLFNNQDGSTTWQPGLTQNLYLYPSFYKSSRPAWWGSLAWPAIGPDVLTGDIMSGHAYSKASNPAMNCFYNVMGGLDGGDNSPLSFNANACYYGASVSDASISPTSLTFSAQTVGTTSPGQTVTLSNTGSATLNIASIAVTGDYAQTNTCGSTLGAGNNCSITVTFTPTTTGTRTGTLTVTDDSGGVSGSTQTASLTGTGTGSGGGGITAVGSGVKADNTGAGTGFKSYTPTTGNEIVIGLNVQGTISGVSCVDNNSNALTAGPSIAYGTSHPGSLYMFYGTAVSGASSYKCSWTTSQPWSFTLQEYSGNTHGVNAGLTGNTSSGTGTTASATVTTDENNDWIVCGLGDGRAFTLSASTGTSRQQITAGSARETLVDNAIATAGSGTCAATLTSADWGAAVIELRP